MIRLLVLVIIASRKLCNNKKRHPHKEDGANITKTPSSCGWCFSWWRRAYTVNNPVKSHTRLLIKLILNSVVFDLNLVD
jgi:hypothetical protein